jgi:hypothetical protein
LSPGDAPASRLITQSNQRVQKENVGMAIVMIMEWQGVDLKGYEEVRRITNFEGDPPAGGMFHVAALDGDRLRVVDVWESAEAFQAFVQARLMPATQQAGITAQPDVKILPAHNIFTPAYNPK